MLAVVCAVVAALMYAAASVLQQRSAAAQGHEHSLRLGLLTRLVQNPAWLLGIAADVAGYVLQFVALSLGTLVVVQPLLVCGLLFALPIGARVGAARLHRSDWAAAVAVCLGLAVFLTIARPANGHPDVRTGTWIELLVPSAAVCVVLLAIATKGHRQTRHKSVLLSAVAGISYGVAAALTKAVAHQLGRGIPTVFLHWQVYLLAVVGVGGMLVAQSAFQAGTLDASLPTMTVVDPIVSILIGAFAFGESITIGGGRAAIEVVALLVMSVGVFALARTTAVQHLHGDSPTRAA
ncbi:DMT family transporter [Acidiferrimicrobium sp. IK]|uniref:DMT family transporter n=1 Tax=Acidiferrimicrobium sp. IK TaxID=2871700 RepID=UPI0021CAEFF8|nr:DMT family transporter [Acidiferrimicrobium sp. IK]MCU4187053.1 DMT family transporter [Acidiferrimicrobium sp. IK]